MCQTGQQDQSNWEHLNPPRAALLQPTGAALERRTQGPERSSLSVGPYDIYDVRLFFSQHSTVQGGDKNAIFCGCPRGMPRSLEFAISLSLPFTPPQPALFGFVRGMGT